MDTWREDGLQKVKDVLRVRFGKRQAQGIILGVELRNSQAAAGELAILRNILVQRGLISSRLWWHPASASQYREHVTVAHWHYPSSQTKDRPSDMPRTLTNWMSSSRNSRIIWAIRFKGLDEAIDIPLA